MRPTLALIALLLATPAVAQEYKIKFDNWPDNTSSAGICTLDNTGNHYNRPECEGHLLGRATVMQYPECRSGKCWKRSYSGDEDSGYLYPCSESGQCKASGYTNTWSVPSAAPSGNGGKTVYVRYWIRFGDDFYNCGSGNCFGGSNGNYQLKQARFIVDGAFPHFTGIRSGVFHDESSNCYVDVGFHELPQGWYKLESEHDAIQRQVKLWVSGSDGQLITSKTCSYTFPGATFSRMAWIQGNYSTPAGWPPGGGQGTRTVFMDDVCVSYDESARTGFCSDNAVVRPNPPVVTGAD